MIQCAESGAAATGATVKYSTNPSYAELIPNLTLARQFTENWEYIGVSVDEQRPQEHGG